MFGTQDPKSVAPSIVPTSFSNDSINKEPMVPQNTAFLLAFPVISSIEHRRLSDELLYASVPSKSSMAKNQVAFLIICASPAARVLVHCYCVST